MTNAKESRFNLENVPKLTQRVSHLFDPKDDDRVVTLSEGGSHKGWGGGRVVKK